MNLDFLGRGWSFPPTFDPTVPGVEMLEQETDVASSLQILLTTAMGERIMVPEYGCNLDDLIFESLDTRTKTLIADKVDAAITYFEPRVELESVSLDDSGQLEGVVLIQVIYRIITTNTRYNFVFPYYKQEGTDLNLPVTVQVLPD